MSMRKLTVDDLKQLIENHGHWLREDCDGWENMQADLSGADLYGADLSRATLYGADLSGANLYGANLEKTLIDKFFPLACPETGSFIGWKKAIGIDSEGKRNLAIVKLEILEDAKRSSAFGRKCRCSAAKVLAIEPIIDNCLQTSCDRAISSFNQRFLYKVGEIVSVPDFDEDRTHECAPGIHFFITRQEAVDYVL
jgi:hypothetical protein